MMSTNMLFLGVSPCSEWTPSKLCFYVHRPVIVQHTFTTTQSHCITHAPMTIKQSSHCSLTIKLYRWWNYSITIISSLKFCDSTPLPRTLSQKNCPKLSDKWLKSNGQTSMRKRWSSYTLLRLLLWFNVYATHGHQVWLNCDLCGHNSFHWNNSICHRQIELLQWKELKTVRMFPNLSMVKKLESEIP